ncbi:thiol:disulfide interchange protein DsbA/DsbL [Montanilutibacter psychrotolerans]|uniref:Thiol:disulfide interchange protein DsbA n=1 Tax=Montanilutibacter psychrotolerans TaxID=1327343 RepID=A0A3M8SNH3_9GAMM|nr:thiol:disulfide interchange protein DsbA/DsbL [Lysobacter psychrotolerans]RNF82881.1 thiol:disulfide interchange protein DsbA/DsbL [Lysobacter psychrotolerans]
MTSRLSVLLLALLTLSACTQQSGTPVADGTSPAPTAETAPAAGTEAAPPVAAEPEAARTPGPIVPPTGPEPVVGTDFVEVAGGQPFQPGSGQIEVVEVFGYTCPHCATFEPMIDAWQAKLPADVKFTPIAAPFGGYWLPYAKAFYTAESMGLLRKTHTPMFNAVHIDRTLPIQGVTDEQIASFYAKYGADAKQFQSTMSSFAVDAKLKRAAQFLQRTGVEATPTIIINGKYRVIGKGPDDALRIAEHLIARERAANATTAPAPAAAPADTASSAAAPANGG